ncbi:MAG: MurR/RpiR family transcriptional regulator, partial [Kordiimonas sp.]
VNVFNDETSSFLVDVGKRDVLLVFDFRRYQEETVKLTQAAAQKGAEIILITDPYLSPIAEEATVVLSTTIEAPSPFDSYVPAFAMIEALIAGLVTELGDKAKQRISELEKNRSV